jgi:hypothetical protein
MNVTANSVQLRIYDRTFVLAYASNLFMMTAISLLYRYADFVRLAGGDEWNLGMIVGFGALGAMVFRFVQGVAIDRFGPMAIWLASIGLVTLSLLWHLRIDTIAGWEVFRGDAVGGRVPPGFRAWMSFISCSSRAASRGSPWRCGIVGFAGMAMGPWIGDWIFPVACLRGVKCIECCGLRLTSSWRMALAIWACRANGDVRRPPAEATRRSDLVRLRHPWYSSP